MNSIRGWVVAVVALGLVADASSAQDVSRYRDYALGSTVESVVAASGARATDAETIHERPAKIQQLEWRAPYVSSASPLADPVKDIAFAFFNDALYRVVVNYDRARTDGLTSADIIETLTTSYGAPVAKAARTPATRPPSAHPDAIVIAQWETPVESLTLVRDTYDPAFQLILLSKPLSLRARDAARQALKLDAAEAPQRESDARKKSAAEANATREKTRTTNKAAFRP